MSLKTIKIITLFNLNFMTSLILSSPLLFHAVKEVLVPPLQLFNVSSHPPSLVLVGYARGRAFEPLHDILPFVLEGLEVSFLKSGQAGRFALILTLPQKLITMETLQFPLFD